MAHEWDLVLDEWTGAVETADGTDIPARYAAGRTVVGLWVNSYAGGLSPADCIFSGRRADSSAAGAPHTVEGAADDRVTSGTPVEGV